MTSAPSATTHLFRRRIVVVFIAAGLSLVALPLWLQGSANAVQLTGDPVSGGLQYRDAQIFEVLDDIATQTGFRVVAFPQVRAQRFSGYLPLGRDGKAAAMDLAARTHLVLRNAGPHWALVMPPSANAR